MEQVYFALAECRAAQVCDGAPLFVLGMMLAIGVCLAVSGVIYWLMGEKTC